MLASLLCNLAVPSVRQVRADSYYDRFVVVEGETFDTQDKPEKAVIRKLVKAAKRVELPKAERSQVDSLIRELGRLEQLRLDVDSRIESIIAFRRLAELLKKTITEARNAEEEALLMLLLEI